MTVDFILDANVLVSAQITRVPTPPLRAFLAIGNQEFQHYVSGGLLREFSSVMRRPRLARLHRLSPREIDELTAVIAGVSIDVVAPRCAREAPDPKDQHLWDMLAALEDPILVTGDRLLLESGDFPGRVLTSRQFVERYLDRVY